MSNFGRLVARRLVSALAIITISCGAVAAVSPTASASHTNLYLCGHWGVGNIKHRYEQVSGTLGCPTSDELTNPGNTGKRQHFGPRGNIYWKNGYTNAYSIWGAIWDRYAAAGYETSYYQYPSTNEGCRSTDGTNSNYFWQMFKDNCYIIFWSPTAGYVSEFHCD